MRKLLLIMLIFVLPLATACPYLSAGQANASQTRKLIVALDRAANNTRIALNTNIGLARAGILKPDLALSFNESLRKFNSGVTQFYNFIGRIVVFDEKGNGVLKLSLAQQDEANKLLDAISAAASDVLGDEALGGSIARQTQYKQLIESLTGLSKQLAAALARLKASVDTLTIPLNLQRRELERMKEVFG